MKICVSASFQKSRTLHRGTALVYEKCVDANDFMYLEPDPRHVWDMNLASNLDAWNVQLRCDNEYFSAYNVL